MDARTSPLSVPQIIAVVERLSLPELEEVARCVLALRAARRAPHLCAKDAALLQRINHTLPEDLTARLHILMAKHKIEGLSETEYTELASFTDRLEVLQADRMAALVTLAQRRGTTVDDVMQQLGMHFPDHD
jgi:hypothetical protein